MATVTPPPLTPSSTPRPSVPYPSNYPPLHNRNRMHGILTPIIFVLAIIAITVACVVLWLYMRRRKRVKDEGYPGWQLHRGMGGSNPPVTTSVPVAGDSGGGGAGVGGTGGGEGTEGERVPAVTQAPVLVEAFAPVRVSVPAQAQPVTQGLPVEHYAPATRDSVVARAPPVVVTSPPPKVSYG